MTFNFHSDGLTYKSESGGQTINNQDISITQNGEYTAESGYTGLGTVSVNVADVPAVITSLSITPSTTAQTITAPTGTDGYSPISVSAVTASIDSNITAENIKDGVEILGVTGNYQGSGGGGIGGNGKYLVQVIDYNGDLLKAYYHDTGETFTLPEPPTHEKLTFVEWSSPVTITNNTITVGHSDITIGALYTTKSGLSEFDIVVPPGLGEFYFRMGGTKNWGDGTSNKNQYHTYSSPGNYTITCDGTAFAGGSSGLIGSSPTYNEQSLIREARIVNCATIPQYCFYQQRLLKGLSLDNNVTKIDSNAISYTGLSTLVIPYTVTTYGASIATYSPHLKAISISSAADFSGYMLNNNQFLESLTIPDGVTSIGSYAIMLTNSLKKLTFPASITSIGTQAFLNTINIEEYDFTDATSVPTLSAASTFNVTANTRFRVPASLLNTWKAATNWVEYAAYIVAG